MRPKEYTQDNHHDEVTAIANDNCAKARVARAAAARTMDGASFNELHNKRVSSAKLHGQRVHTNCIPEWTAPVIQEEALGHRLYVVGLMPRQFIYCEILHCLYGDPCEEPDARSQGYALSVSSSNHIAWGKTS